MPESALICKHTSRYYIAAPIIASTLRRRNFLHFKNTKHFIRIFFKKKFNLKSILFQTFYPNVDASRVVVEKHGITTRSSSLRTHLQIDVFTKFCFCRTFFEATDCHYRTERFQIIVHSLFLFLPQNMFKL